MEQQDQTGPWASARVATIIESPLESIFAFVCNPQNDPLWMPKLGPARQLTEGPIGPGARFQQSVIFFGGHIDVEWQITELVPDRRVAGKSVAGPITFTGGYEFERAGASTLVTKFGAVRLSKIFSFLPTDTASSLLIDEFQNALERLKRLLERGPAA